AQADADQQVLVVPGAAGQVGGQRDGVLAPRLGVVVGEVVDQLLGADGILGGQAAVGEVAADVGVGGGVDADGQGGQGGSCRQVERVVHAPAVLLRLRVFRTGHLPRVRVNPALRGAPIGGPPSLGSSAGGGVD